MAELKPCPFCKKVVELFDVTHLRGEMEHWCILCIPCDVSMKQVYVVGAHVSSDKIKMRKTIIKRWNSRPNEVHGDAAKDRKAYFANFDV